jgi:hypothetical protein
MGNRINKAIEEAKKLLAFCPDEETKSKMELQIKTMEILRDFNIDFEDRNLPKGVNDAIDTINRIYNKIASN